MDLFSDGSAIGHLYRALGANLDDDFEQVQIVFYLCRLLLPFLHTAASKFSVVEPYPVFPSRLIATNPTILSGLDVSRRIIL